MDTPAPMTNLPNLGMPGTTEINWGGVVKGVAIVAAVAVAAVVGLAVFSAAGAGITAMITHNAVASSLAGGAMQAATWSAGALGTGINFIGGMLSAIPGLLVNVLGLSNVALAPAAATGANHLIGIAGAGAAAAVATHAALPHLNSVHLTTTSPSPIDGGPDTNLTSGVFAAGTGAHATSTASIHEMAHAAHGAHELSEQQRERAEWTNKFASRGGFTSYADSVRARKEDEKPIQPRDANFAEQLNADRANLDAALER